MSQDIGAATVTMLQQSREASAKLARRNLKNHKPQEAEHFVRKAERQAHAIEAVRLLSDLQRLKIISLSAGPEGWVVKTQSGESFVGASPLAAWRKANA